MMRHSVWTSVMALGLLAGCAGGVAERYSVPPAQASERVSIRYGSVEIRDVTLPSYAAAEEITSQAPGGVLTSNTSVLWADAPERAIALELVRHLSTLTGARVASDPWPFEAFPDATLEVRFEQLLAGADGVFRATGQFFVAVEEGRERSGLFDLSVPLGAEANAEASPAAIATARGQIILDLAGFIAKNGLR